MRIKVLNKWFLQNIILMNTDKNQIINFSYRKSGEDY